MMEDINDLAGLSKTKPALAAVFTIFMFSMAGIPPLAGFLGKLYVFRPPYRLNYLVLPSSVYWLAL